MKHLTLHIFILLIAFSGYAQMPFEFDYHSDSEQTALAKYLKGDETNLLQLALVIDSTNTSSELNDRTLRLDKTINRLRKKMMKTKNEGAFLSHLFYLVHRKYLKQYQEHSTVSSIFESGNYDCLSATMLYSTIFTRLGIAHAIVETDFHTYIEIKDDKRLFLIESTDPYNGFIENHNDIEERKQRYASGFGSKPNHFKLTSGINNRISLRDAIGLQYFNEAVESFNNNELRHCVNLLQKACIFKKLDLRFKNMTYFLANNIQHSTELNNNKKIEYLRKLAILSSLNNNSLAVR